MWKQVISPILTQEMKVKSAGKYLADWCGWCLATTQTQFGVAPFADCARTAWEKNTARHLDRDLPEGVWTTIFWVGDKDNYGHIACAKRTGQNVEIWTSPYTHKPYFDIFSGELNTTIDKISKIYGLKGYVGWTETLNNTRLIEYVEPAPDPIEEQPVPETNKTEPTCEPTATEAKQVVVKMSFWQAVWNFIKAIFTRSSK